MAGIEVWGVEGWEGADELVVTATPAATFTLDGGNGNDGFEIAPAGLGANLSVSDPGGTDRLDLVGTDGSEAFTVSGAGVVTGGRTVDVGVGIDATSVDTRGGNDDVIVSFSATATIDTRRRPGQRHARVASNGLHRDHRPGHVRHAGPAPHHPHRLRGRAGRRQRVHRHAGRRRLPIRSTTAVGHARSTCWAAPTATRP